MYDIHPHSNTVSPWFPGCGGVLNQIAKLTGEVSSSAARAKQGAARMKHLKATAKTTEKEMKVTYGSTGSQSLKSLTQSASSADTVCMGIQQ